MPEIALIGVGKDNSFGHPSDGTIERLNKIKCKILRTDENGEIKVLIKENDDKNQSMIDKLNLEIDKLKQYQAQAEKEKQNEISLAVSKEKENSIQTKN